MRILGIGKKDESTWAWRVQWHVTADGVVIHQRSKGDEAHQQLFQTFTPTRPVTVAELEARDRGTITSFDVVWWTGLTAYVVGSALLGGLVLHRSGGNVVAGLIIGVVLGAGLSPFVFRLFMLFALRDGGSGTRRWVESGRLPAMATMKATEARALIAAPGTTSGVVTRAKRA